AHNPAAAEALAATLQEAFTWDRLHLVLAVFSNKDLAGIVRHLAPLTDRAYAATTSSVRARPTEQIAAALAEADVPVEGFPSIPAAIAGAQEAAAPDDLILVTGSLYTVADARRSLRPTFDGPAGSSSLGKEP